MKVLEASLAVLVATPLATAAATLGSREYKVLLRAEKFQENPVVNAANEFLSDLMKQVDNGPAISGSFKPHHDRTVMYYDSPGHCVLRERDYGLRSRIEDGKRKISLKFRSTDQAKAAARDVSGSSKKAKTKFEQDITPQSSKYSHSTKQPLSDSKNINKIKDIKDLYPTTTQFDDVSDDALVPIGGLNIHELTFDGPTSDLGDGTAEFTATVWYDGDSKTPSIAEISFELAANEEKVFTSEVSANAQDIFQVIQGMDNWVAANSTTKTTWVYAHDPSFCESDKKTASCPKPN